MIDPVQQCGGFFCRFVGNDLDMEEITGEEFLQLLYIGQSSFENLSINNSGILYVNLDRILYDIALDNVKFSGSQIRFKGGYSDTSFTISSNNCNFISTVIFDNANIDLLDIEDCTFHDKFLIRNCKIKDLTILNTEINGRDFSIRKTVISFVHIDNITIPIGSFSLSNSNFSVFTIINSAIQRIHFIQSSFSDFFDFINNTIEFTLKFSFANCEFGKTSFAKTIFQTKMNFNECDFKKVVNFSSTNGNFGEFSYTTFDKYVNFNDSKFVDLKLTNVKFSDSVSFNDSQITNFTIDNTIFEKNAVFDSLKILNIKNCNRITLRNIKQQLQKGDNRIDYNKFRSYEMAAYYRELNWNWEDSKDKFILGATWLVTGFDHSWRRALAFTLLAATLFYSLFFISEKYNLEPSLSGTKEFISGYFRFLLLTDFYNPLSDGRKYIDNTNTIGWFIFIFGKIVIAFGIYEMIQAFRKFKA